MASKLAESTSVTILTQLFSLLSCLCSVPSFSENSVRQNPQAIVHLVFLSLTLTLCNTSLYSHINKASPHPRLLEVDDKVSFTCSLEPVPQPCHPILAAPSSAVTRPVSVVENVNLS